MSWYNYSRNLVDPLITKRCDWSEIRSHGSVGRACWPDQPTPRWLGSVPRMWLGGNALNPAKELVQGAMAQLVEHIVHIDGVVGSSPTGTTTWPVNSDVYRFFFGFPRFDKDLTFRKPRKQVKFVSRGRFCKKIQNLTIQIVPLSSPFPRLKIGNEKLTATRKAFVHRRMLGPIPRKRTIKRDPFFYNAEICKSPLTL